MSKTNNSQGNKVGTKPPQPKPAPKGTSENFIPALMLSPLFGDFKRNAKVLSEKLAPLGITISAFQKALADYVARKCNFEVDKDLLSALQDYEKSKVAWESFRDSFRSAKDAQTIPTGALEALLGGNSGGQSSK